MAPHPESVPSRYINRVLSTKPGARLVGAGLFPNAKEVTESFGGRQALTRVPAVSPRDGSVLLLSVGDGTTPRTAATFAVTTRWQCHSIDPRLRGAQRWRDLPRLTTHPAPIEELSFVAETVVVVMVHAHVDVPTVLRSVTADRVVVISMPCCVPPAFPGPPAVHYRDVDIASPQNEVLIWWRGLGD